MNTRMHIVILSTIAAFLVCILMTALGCAATHSSPYTTQSQSARNPLKAQQLTQEAVAIFAQNPAKAERVLREALTADLYHGPAHNDLGVLYLEKGKLYEAAQEFEWARRLMPGHPDPRLNLALTLERAGRIDEALDEYRTALEVYPGHIQTIEAMTRCTLRHAPDKATDDSTLTTNLEAIALRGENKSWRTWAQLQLKKRKQRE